jgi:hypothetical protein
MLKQIVLAAALALTALPAAAQDQGPPPGGQSEYGPGPQDQGGPQGPGGPQGYGPGGQQGPGPMITPEVRQAHQAMMQACSTDVQNLCQGVPRQGGQMMKCLRSNMAKASQGCQSAFQNLRSARMAARSQMGAGPNGAPQGQNYQGGPNQPPQGQPQQY